MSECKQLIQHTHVYLMTACVPSVWPTWEFDPLVCITNRPHIHHHVHPTRCKVLVIRGPGQRHWFGMVSVKLTFDLRKEIMHN